MSLFGKFGKWVIFSLVYSNKRERENYFHRLSTFLKFQFLHYPLVTQPFRYCQSRDGRQTIHFKGGTHSYLARQQHSTLILGPEGKINQSSPQESKFISLLNFIIEFAMRVILAARRPVIIAAVTIILVWVLVILKDEYSTVRARRTDINTIQEQLIWDQKNASHNTNM